MAAAPPPAAATAASSPGLCPSYAVVCSFLERYGALLDLPELTFPQLERYLQDTASVPKLLVDLHVKLLRKIGKSVSADRWEKHIIKICSEFNTTWAWELEQKGYKDMAVECKIGILKYLCECQFDDNVKFKNTINEDDPDKSRQQPIGRDKDGQMYWFQLDQDNNVRVYVEEQDDLSGLSWKCIVRDRNDLAEILALLKTQIDPAMFAKKEKEEGSSPKSEDAENIKNGEEVVVKKTETDEEGTSSKDTACPVSPKTESNENLPPKDEVRSDLIEAKSPVNGIKDEKDELDPGVQSEKPPVDNDGVSSVQTIKEEPMELSESTASIAKIEALPNSEKSCASLKTDQAEDAKKNAAEELQRAMNDQQAKIPLKKRGMKLSEGFDTSGGSRIIVQNPSVSQVREPPKIEQRTEEKKNEHNVADYINGDDQHATEKGVPRTHLFGSNTDTEKHRNSADGKRQPAKIISDESKAAETSQKEIPATGNEGIKGQTIQGGRNTQKSMESETSHEAEKKVLSKKVERENTVVSGGKESSIKSAESPSHVVAAEPQTPSKDATNALLASNHKEAEKKNKSKTTDTTVACTADGPPAVKEMNKSKSDSSDNIVSNEEMDSSVASKQAKLKSYENSANKVAPAEMAISEKNKPGKPNISEISENVADPKEMSKREMGPKKPDSPALTVMSGVIKKTDTLPSDRDNTHTSNDPKEMVGHPSVIKKTEVIKRSNDTGSLVSPVDTKESSVIRKEDKHSERLENTQQMEGSSVIKKAEKADAPKQAEKTPARKQAEKADAPKQAEKADAPKQAEKTDAPKRAEKTDAPKRAEKTDAPKQAEKTDTPKRAEKTDAPKQAEKADAPKQAEKTDVPKRAEKTQACKQTEKTDAPKQAEKMDAPKQAVKTDAPKQAEKTHARKQTEKTDAPKQADKTDAPKQADKTDAPKQAEKTDALKQTGKTDAPKQVEKADAPKQAEKTDAPKQAEKTDAPKQAEKPDALKQAEKTHARKQTEKTDAPKQAEKTDAPKQAEKTLARKQTDKTDAPKQAEKTDAPKQAEKTLARKQTDKTDAPKQAEKTDAPKQAEKTLARKQTDKTDAPKQAEKTDAPKQVEKADTPKRAEKTDAPKQAEKSDAPKRVEKTDAPKQAEKAEAPKRAEKTDAPKQAEKADAPKRAEKTDASKQTDKSDADKINAPKQTRKMDAPKRTENNDAHKQAEKSDSLQDVAMSEPKEEKTVAADTASEMIRTEEKERLLQNKEPITVHSQDKEIAKMSMEVEVRKEDQSEPKCDKVKAKTTTVKKVEEPAEEKGKTSCSVETKHVSKKTVEKSDGRKEDKEQVSENHPANKEPETSSALPKEDGEDEHNENVKGSDKESPKNKSKNHPCERDSKTKDHTNMDDEKETQENNDDKTSNEIEKPESCTKASKEPVDEELKDKEGEDESEEESSGAEKKERVSRVSSKFRKEGVCPKSKVSTSRTKAELLREERQEDSESDTNVGRSLRRSARISRPSIKAVEIQDRRLEKLQATPPTEKHDEDVGDKDSEEEDKDDGVKAVQKKQRERNVDPESQSRSKGRKRRKVRWTRARRKKKGSGDDDDDDSGDFSSEDWETEEEDDSDESFKVERSRRRRNQNRERRSDASETSSEDDLPPNDDPCKHCGLPNHPELILLCDSCDSGYHTACLRPPLMIIPDGEWFCQLCQHKQLCDKLEEQLQNLDAALKKKERADRRKERLVYVGISVENIITPSVEVEDEKEKVIVKKKEIKRTKSWGRRSTRVKKNISYRFDEFDEAIEEAIEEDIKEAEGGGAGRGKDMANITGHNRGKDINVILNAEEGKENGGPPKPAAGPRRKKRRRLNDLDSDSTADEDESEDEFRLTESSDEDEFVASDNAESASDGSNDSGSAGSGGRRRSSRAKRQPKRRKSARRRRRGYSDDEEEETDEDDEEELVTEGSSEFSDSDLDMSRRRSRRSLKKQVNYCETSESEGSRTNRNKFKPRRRPGSSESEASSSKDSEDEPSERRTKRRRLDSSEEETRQRRMRASLKRRRASEEEDDSSSSDESSGEEDRPVRKRVNRIDSDDDDEEEEEEKGKKGAVEKDEEEGAVLGKGTSPLDYNLGELPPTNGQSPIKSLEGFINRPGAGASGLITNLEPKNASATPAAAIAPNGLVSQEMAPQDDDEDDLLGVTDLVAFVCSNEQL